MYRSELKNFDMPDFVISDFYMNVEQIEDRKAYLKDIKKTYDFFKSNSQPQISE